MTSFRDLRLTSMNVDAKGRSYTALDINKMQSNDNMARKYSLPDVNAFHKHTFGKNTDKETGRLSGTPDLMKFTNSEVIQVQKPDDDDNVPQFGQSLDY